jgi:hypothetical protein
MVGRLKLVIAGDAGSTEALTKLMSDTEFEASYKKFLANPG